MTSTNKPEKTPLYNGPMETALRTLVCLDAFGGGPMDITELRALEFFAVYGQDVGYPTSLQHPAQGRAGAHGFRIDYILKGIDLLLGAGLIERPGFQAVDADEMSVDYWNIALTGRDISSLYGVSYFAEMKAVCDLMRGQGDTEGRDRFFGRLGTLLARMKTEPLDMPPSDPQFSFLRDNYARDLLRMQGLAHGAALVARIARGEGGDEAIAALGDRTVVAALAETKSVGWHAADVAEFVASNPAVAESLEGA